MKEQQKHKILQAKAIGNKRRDHIRVKEWKMDMRSADED